ncbi:DUF1127 domain-containing protein [Ponticoccus sp. SC2-23]|uniref:DUF1127 domain-containing protein n=1 Tax=Alexandriicola marinus TaxID=2081710 RepID=UPI000FD918AA|nr:DUF1127 domain-containing protein [Alexandriicola marinus]MBM1219711.1 DUF1127 domain-containing protein [Ponticoccus sp. SC6-9]MBM1223217.1 DUF1127 domain-containing protein [Ponticoccus sp. SC6-15]MBM1229524.1 DUF1127 domain-containing protein [Ponticoccus sp. SC6-38]MBM1232183.1 DUF1127 domain-containing protein [Ponticoccus sp. SC6-45]MBM1237867.1 DUF1127 domain-containing protein [Ponticoccus sp. SC6-49]MBM1241194.1 DUF1127 domain-containing protein [Ponticoccus sp. SC2-64]MBM1245707
MVRLDALGRARTARPSTPVFALIRAAFCVWRQRRHLARLDRDLLADLGLCADEAQKEAARPIWDVPGHWRR